MVRRAAASATFRLVDPPAGLKAGLAEVARLFPERFPAGNRGMTPLHFRPLPRAAAPERRAEAAVGSDSVTLVYSDAARAFRALGRVMGRLAAGKPAEAFAEQSAFASAGVMLDCSRGAVPTMAKAREWIVRSALMGLDQLLFYTEDTYEVPGEPFFGYGRGGFTQKELRSLDDFAYACGVELVPCIQTLGHLERPLRWEVYRELRDQPGVLLIDEPATYKLLDRIIAAASKPFRTKRIHVGMDEAHGVGLGRYHELHGTAPRFDLMTRHLGKVRELCAKRGLTPWMWSDMFFRLGSRTNDYYDPGAKFPKDLAKKIPADVKLVYWDYYHQDEAFYREYIARHRSLGTEPPVALGAWSWGCFWPQMAKAFATIDPCMKACRAAKIRETFITVWGDDGTECDLTAAFLPVQRYAEFCYDGAPPDERLREGFLGCVGGHWDDWVAAAAIDAPPGFPQADKELCNPSKWLLWQDPLLSHLDPQINLKTAVPHYEKEARRLAALAAKDAHAATLRLPALLAAAVAKKAPLRARAAAAVKAKDKAAARALLRRDLPVAVRAVEALWKHHRAVWFANNRPNGWEAIEQRYGTLLARLETFSDRLSAWVKTGTEVPELTERFLPMPKNLTEEYRWRNYHHCVAY